MMQPELTGRADVHSGPFTHRLHAAKDLNRVGGVVTVSVRQRLAVLRFGFKDRGVDFFCRHSEKKPVISPTSKTRGAGCRTQFPVPANLFKLLKLRILTETGDVLDYTTKR